MFLNFIRNELCVIFEAANGRKGLSYKGIEEGGNVNRALRVAWLFEHCKNNENFLVWTQLDLQGLPVIQA